MYQEAAVAVYFAHWLILAALYVYIRRKMKLLHPARHEIIFGKSWTTHSVYNSIRFIKFALKRTQWFQIEDSNLIKALNLHRYIGISFLIINFVLLLGIVSAFIYALVFGA
jgi:presenilin-like A22 family membrane protease